MGLLLDQAGLRARVGALIARDVERGLINPDYWAEERAALSEVPADVKRACMLAAKRLCATAEWQAISHDGKTVSAARTRPDWPAA